MSEHNYLYKGEGKMMGIDFLNDKLYADFCLSSSFFEHIKIECDEHGNYIPSGDVLVKPTRDIETIEKMQIKVKPLAMKKKSTSLTPLKHGSITGAMEGQISIFSF